MSSVGYSTNKRPGTAFAAAAEAKARRQKIVVVVLCVLLVAVLAFEAPTFMKLIGGSSSKPAVLTAPSVTTPPTVSSKKALINLRKRHAVDPFSATVTGVPDTGFRDVAIPPGSHDPFASRSAGAASAPSGVSTASLPQKTIVVGKPGGNRIARHGWIVILASIPTANGRSSATRFATTARQNGIDSISVLNSSNRRPLRGGYWVVYTGPFKTLSDVSSQASHVHSRGYATAYIRELIVYS